MYHFANNFVINHRGLKGGIEHYIVWDENVEPRIRKKVGLCCRIVIYNMGRVRVNDISGLYVIETEV